jgi:hypothetical protein
MPKATSSADAPSSSSSSSSTSSSSSSSPPAAVVARSPTTPSSHDAAEAASANVDNDADCRDCLSYLTRALDANGSSRTMSLLRALGAMSHRRGGVAGGGGGDDDDDDARAGSMRGGGMCDDDGGGVDDDGGRVYEPLAGGRGVLISLSNSDASREALRLRRRMRNAATATTTPISHAAESSVGVLTTSPSSSSSRRASSRDDDDVDFDVDAITTIAIECATCGSDTRAEAGARAFVSGPDNLGIVLCSNRLSSQSEIDEVLVHELVHIYGECAFFELLNIRDMHGCRPRPLHSTFMYIIGLKIHVTLFNRIWHPPFLSRRPLSSNGFEGLQAARLFRGAGREGGGVQQ